MKYRIDEKLKTVLNAKQNFFTFHPLTPCVPQASRQTHVIQSIFAYLGHTEEYFGHRVLGTAATSSLTLCALDSSPIRTIQSGAFVGREVPLSILAACFVPQA